MRIQSLLFGVLIMSLLSGCGFQLRGSQTLPATWGKVAVVAEANVNPSLVTSVRNLWKTQGVQLTNNAAADTYIILISDSTQRRVLSRDEQGRDLELEIQQRLEYRVENKEGDSVLPTQSVQRTRNFVNNVNNVLGTSGEEQTVRDELTQELANTLLRRLSVSR